MSGRTFGRDCDSSSHWNETGATYVDALDNRYHRQRLAIIEELIPRDLMTAGARIVDFGCGDGVLLPPFLAAGASIAGIDASASMIAAARGRLAAAGFDPALVQVGGAADLARIPSASLDGLLSFNVLAYLTDEEERTFYSHAARIVRPGGYLVVTNSNELFDLFSLNALTRRFFERHLVAPEYHEHLASLLPRGDEAAAPYNVRENPLTYKDKLAAPGFAQQRQAFINWHHAPPAVLGPSHDYPIRATCPHRSAGPSHSRAARSVRARRASESLHRPLLISWT